MKKLFTLMILLLIWAGSSWATTVQVGSGTATSAYLPIRAYYGYTYSQQIYTQAQIATAGNITKLRFYLSSGTPTNSSAWVVYMGHTTKTTFTSTTDWVPVGSMTQVFSGTVTFPAAGNWMEITLNTSFSYNNTNNLVIAVDENTPSYAASDCYWYSFTSGTNTGIYYYNDNTNPDPAAPPTGILTSNINQVQFEIVPAGTPALSAIPGSLGFGYSPNGTPTASQSYVLSGSYLTAGPIVVTAPSGFQVSSNNTNWFSTINVTYTPPTLPNTTIYSRFNPSGSPADYGGDISNVGGGASANVTVSGTSIYSFCAADGGCDEYISEVVMGTIDNSSACDGYADYTSLSTNMYKNTAYTITVTNGTPYTGDYCGIWVDWNKDGDLEDAGESMTVLGGPTTYTATITPPLDAFEGPVGLRTRIVYYETPVPCGSSSFGEVEDYTINVLPVPTTPVFNINPISKNYGNCPMNNLSSEYFTQTFTVSNIGAGTLNITAVSLTGGDISQFVLTDANTYPVGLSGTSTLVVTVKFSPTTIGPKATTLRVVEDGTIDHDIPLSGTGIVYPPENLSGITTPEFTNILDWDPPLPEGEIRYDNGTASNWYWVASPSGATDYFYTRFTAPVSGNLDYVSLFQRNSDGTTDWSSIMVCAENGTTNTPDITSPLVTYTAVPVNSMTGEWKVLQLTPAIALTAGTDFFLVTHWPSASSYGPFVGTDATTDAGRCGWSSTGTTWNTIAMSFIMRAYMSTTTRSSYTLTSGIPNPSLASLPVKEAVSYQGRVKGQIERSARIPVPGLSADNGSRSLIDYTVLRGASSTTLSSLVSGILTTGYTDADVVPSTTYYYGVIARYSGDMYSDTSNIIGLTTNPLCIIPTGLTTSSLNKSGATFSWTNPTGTMWDLYVVPASDPDPTETSSPTIDNYGSTSYEWADGSPETAYKWFVRNDCDADGVSAWAGPANFTTTQVPADVPYEEGWESGLDNWALVNGTAVNQWVVGSATFNSGTSSAYISNTAGTTNHYDSVSTSIVHMYRDIMFTGGTAGYTLTFWWKGFGESGYDWMECSVIDPSVTPVAGTMLSAGQVGADHNLQATWVMATVTLPGTLTGGIHRLVFTWKNDSSVGTQPPAAVDDISIVAISCPAPTLNAPTAGYTTANVSWVAGGSETQWEYFYCETGCGGPVGPGIYTTSNSVLLSGLTEATTYQFWVRAFCDPDYSSWTGPVSFTTNQSCPAPSGLNVSDVSSSEAKLGWTSNAPGTSWDVELGLSGFTVDNGEQLLSWEETTENPVQATGLSGATSYDFYVREVCDYQSPKIDNFFLAMNGDFVADPLLSGGYTQTVEPGETLIWERYDQTNPFWYNIWFYDDPVDATRMKRVSMGFWIKKLDPDVPIATYDYVINWSTADWNPVTPGYPTPMDEGYIQRSDSHGQIDLTEDSTWVEINYSIYDFNPAWVSVDIWGANIRILDEMREPPMTSRLHYWWMQNPQRGGIIVHECLPKPHGDVSPWSGPYTFATACNPVSTFPYTEGFEGITWPPLCWEDPVTADYGWNQSIYGTANSGTEWAYCNLASSEFFAPDYTLPSGMRLVFYYRVESSGYPQSMQVRINGSSVYQITSAINTIYQRVEIPLDAYAGLTVSLSFLCQTGTGGWDFGICLDDVAVTTYENTWTGASDNIWSNPANWSAGIVPGTLDNVIIPSIPPGGVFPIIEAGVNATCNNVDLQTGATIIVQTGGTLNVINP
jgi:hypothetical protein